LSSFAQEADRRAVEQALAYMGLDPGTPMKTFPSIRRVHRSCTNSRIEDLRAAARVANGGQHVNAKVAAMVVPGSQAIKHAASRKACIAFSSMPGLNGANRDARCVSA